MNNFKNLYKKVDATSKTRFTASRRLTLHSKLSTYSVVIISLGLILIALMQVYSLGLNIKSPYVALVQVFSSIAVLVYSLLINKNDYSNLSEKMYSCASKLGKLKQDIYPYINFEQTLTPEQVEIYSKLKSEYHDILELYETHSINDFKADYKIAKLEMSDRFPLHWNQHISLRVNIFFMYLINFLTYILLLIILISLFTWIWIGWFFYN